MDFRLVPDVNVQVPNGPALMASLHALYRDQIPFASVVSLKRMADLSVLRARGEFPKRFTLRNRGLPRGITYEPRRGPSKRDWPNLKIAVGVDERFSFLVPSTCRSTLARAPTSLRTTGCAPTSRRASPRSTLG